MAFVGGIRLVSLFVGMAVGNWVLGLWGIIFAVSCHRAIEILVIQFLSKSREWFDWRRELIFTPFLLAGMLLGWATDVAIQWLN